MKTHTPIKSPAAYFVNAPFDFLFVGGLSLLTCLAVKFFGPKSHSAFAAELAALLQWVVNWPHFSATTYRLFRSRENTRQYPVTAFVVPVVVFAGAIGALKSPEVLAPYFVKLFLIWSPYHFSGQSVGVSLIYARRNSVRIEGWARWALSAFIFGTYATSTLKGETSVAGSTYYGVDYPGLGVPTWMPVIAEWGMYLGGAAFVWFAVSWMRQNRRVFPLMVLLPGLTQYVWFIAGNSLQAFYVFVPLFHSLQYLPIAWAVEMGETLGAAAERPSWLHVSRRTLQWAAINIAGGAYLFWLLPHTAAGFGIGLSFATGVMIAGVQLHHFFVDGVIWKLRNPRVASPLLANIRDYLMPGAESKVKAAA